MHDNSAVFIRNANKAYGNKEILKGLFMKVERGTIYGLLGASGCGKTTLLSTVVGRKKLDSGELWVLGGFPGAKGSGVPGPRVGYMPQDIALVGEFTVRDAIYYFGRILDMPDSLIEERFEKLSQLLDLPDKDKFIKNCSGGQQRRVSLAASMVHMPELLILDEPTAGVDPLLRDRIWNYLVELTRDTNMAVIITTHYIEEARQAHTIGLMREGKLLAEESPNKLLQIFNTDSLEEVFLVLSLRQEQGRLDNLQSSITDVDSNGIQHGNSTSTIATFDIDHGSTDILTKNIKKKSYKKKQESIGALSLNRNRIKALLDKNWKQFYRNVAGIMFLIIFPIIEVLAFLLAIGPDIKDINLAIVNDETMTTLCPNFTKNGTAIPYSFSSCHLSELSCRFLTYIEDPMIHKIKYDSLSDALEGVKHGEVVGVLYMAENFTESLEVRSNKGKDTDDEILDYSQIKVWMDMSNRQVGATIKYKLYDKYLDFQKDLFTDCNFIPKLADMPIHFEDTIYGKKNESYTVFMTPGVIITLIFYMATMMTSQIIITDRCEGVWDRSIVAGVSSLEITLTHFALQACIVIIHVIEIFIITFLLFRINYIGDLWLIWVIVYLQGICGMSLGFFISIISYNHSMANIVTTGSFYPMLLVCGMMWPIEGMPRLLQYIAQCFPSTIAIQSLRNVMEKGWPVTNFQVWNGIGTTFLWILFLLIISIYSIKRKR